MLTTLSLVIQGFKKECSTKINRDVDNFSINNKKCENKNTQSFRVLTTLQSVIKRFQKMNKYYKERPLMTKSTHNSLF